MKIFENTEYYCGGAVWGLVHKDQPNPDEVRVNVYGNCNEVTVFARYEFENWLREDVIRPICGICKEPQNYQAFPHHVKTHLVKVHG